MTTFEINQKFKEILTESHKKIMKETGDKGTCVGGMKLKYNRYPIADQIAQGSITNELYFDEVKSRLVNELQYESTGFSIEWGWMD